MKPGSVIVDLAVEQGGNCPLSEAGAVTVKHGVTLVGYTNIAGRLPEVASSLYAKNVLNFLTNLWDDENKSLKSDSDDEIITSSLITKPAKAAKPAKATTKKEGDKDGE